MALTRQSLFAKLGLVQVVEGITEATYKELELDIWKNNLGSSPHGQPWHTSFHASSFPGDTTEACGRKAVYSLLNIPEVAPTSRFLRSVGDCGKAIEEELVSRWNQVGFLLSADVGGIQTGFTDEENWLTGNCDAIVLPYRSKRPHVVEVKSKALEKVKEMQTYQRGPDPKHRNQCLTYIGLAHENAERWSEAVVCKKTWRIARDGGLAGNICRVHGSQSDCLQRIKLEPCTSGSVYYLARDDPSQTHEFYFDYDSKFMSEGREKLTQWRNDFANGQLPDRPRHEDGKLVGWSEEPCKWCPLKKKCCKPDYTKSINDILSSHAIEYTKEIRPDYDVNQTIKDVLDRWN